MQITEIITIERLGEINFKTFKFEDGRKIKIDMKARKVTKDFDPVILNKTDYQAIKTIIGDFEQLTYFATFEDWKNSDYVHYCGAGHFKTWCGGYLNRLTGDELEAYFYESNPIRG